MEHQTDIIRNLFGLKRYKTAGVGGCDKMKDGDKVRLYIAPDRYIPGIVVEECGDGTVWVEHSNGQQRHYKASELVADHEN